MTLSDEEIRKCFREKAVNEKITCAQCLKLAKELSIPSKKIGKMLTEMGIKIHNCQLGCFP